MPAASPTISFVIPVRNDARRLERCLAGIARTLYPRSLVQVIVVDHNSHDGSAQVACRAGALLLSSSAGRVSELRNSGAREAVGDLLAFVDADHEIGVGWIRGAVDALSEPSVGAAGAPYSLPPDANWVQRRYHALRPVLSGRQDVDWLGSGNLVIRRTVFAALNGFDTSLETCEDVDLCNRLRRAGHRLVADPALPSVHFGDPSTLRALFFGELWRGRESLRVSVTGPWSFRHLRSAVIAIADLAAIAGAAAALAFGSWWAAAACAAIPVGFSLLKAFAMVRRDARPSLATLAQSFVFAITYDVARALAPLARGTHAARRSSEHTLDVTANSRP